MKVLFIHDVLNVADAGQMKEVAAGYARNYLLPRNLAVVATKGQQNQLDQHMKAIERRREKEVDQLKATAAALDGTTVSIPARVGENNRLYGSITSADIAKALEATTGNPVDRRKIDLTEPIRSAGEHQVSIRYSRDISARVTIVVEGEPVA